MGCTSQTLVQGCQGAARCPWRSAPTLSGRSSTTSRHHDLINCEQRQNEKALYAINTNGTRQHLTTVRALAPDPDLKGFRASDLRCDPQLLTGCFCVKLVSLVHFQVVTFIITRTQPFQFTQGARLGDCLRRLKVAAVIAVSLYGKVRLLMR
jgi:hypothetical protein